MIAGTTHCILRIVFPILCVLGNASDVSRANSDDGKTTLGSNVYVIDTMDGLPVEVELLAVSHGEVHVRMTASGQKMKFDLSTLNQRTRNIIKEFYLKKHGGSNARAFEVSIERNDTPANIVLKQSSFSKHEEAGNKNLSRVLYPGKSCLRLTAKSTSDVDILADAHIYWYAQFQDRPKWEMSGYEKANLLLEAFPSDYLSRPPSFPGAAYQGYVVIISKAGTGDVLWIKSNKDVFIGDAVGRFEKSIPRHKSNSVK